MKGNKIILVLLFLSATLLLTACGSHTHTFAEEWSKDSTHHWHAATCEHTTEVSDKAEHVWDEGVEAKAPTEEEFGTKLYTCICGATKEEEIEKLAHTHKYQEEWSKNATHHWHAASCEHTTEVSGKAEHNWDEGFVILKPIEEAAGKKLHTCTDCGATKEEEIEKLPHTHRYLDTWTTDEEHHWHASACGHEEEVKDLAEHGWDEGTIAKLPTCEADGLEIFECATCGAKKEEVVSKDLNAHRYAKEWSHDETHHWHASICSHDVAGDKAEHSWGEGVVTTEPTLDTEGVKTFTCACGRTKTESIPVLPPVSVGTVYTADLTTLTANTKYSTYKTKTGWTTTNCAVVKGGTTDSNPTFKCIGDGNARAVVLNGKTSAVGKLKSPTLNGGIAKISFNYCLVYSDTKIGLTVNIKDTAGNVIASKVISNNSASKFKVYTFEWELETPVTGDFVVEIVNNSPSKSSSNKDRTAIFNLEWLSVE